MRLPATAAVIIGIGLVAAHTAVFPHALSAWRRQPLAVETQSPPAAPRFSVRGHVVGEYSKDVAVEVDGVPVYGDTPPATPPGLHVQRWRATYRGGHEQAVATAQLVGPFLDPRSPPCSVRIAIGNALLGDGAQTGTIAYLARRELAAALANTREVGIGAFKDISNVTLRWTHPDQFTEDRSLLAGHSAASGYLRALVEVTFSRAVVSVTMALLPTFVDGHIGFETVVAAKLRLRSRLLQWISDVAGGDRLATRVVKSHISPWLVEAFRVPPIDLGRGRQLQLVPCGRGIHITDASHAEMPLAVAFTPLPGHEFLLPPRHGPAAFPQPDRARSVTLDVDLDGLGTILFELWRMGILDEELSRAGLDRRFNDDASVRELLTVRASPLRLPLPPTVSAREGRLWLRALAGLAIADGATETPAELWGEVALRFLRNTGSAAIHADPDVFISALGLTCRPTPTRLEPCYSELFTAMRTRAPDAHGALADALVSLLTRIFSDRSLSGEPFRASLRLSGAEPSLHTHTDNGSVRIELSAHIE